MKFNKRHPLLPEGSEYGMTLIAALALLVGNLRETMLRHKRDLMKWSVLLAVLLLSFLAAFPVFASRDAIAARVLDNANILQDSQEKYLYSLLSDYENETQQQFSIIATNDLGTHKTVKAYSASIFHKWQFDKLEQGALLMVIVPQKQAIHIQVGSQLQSRISEARAKRIADGIMVPWFAHGRYMNGVEEGLSKLLELGRGRDAVILPAQVPEHVERHTPKYIELLLIAIALLGIAMQRWLVAEPSSRVVDDGLGSLVDTNAANRSSGGEW